MNPIDEYIAEQDEAVQDNLNAVRDTIRSVLPDAVEKISWGMPTWWDKHNLIHISDALKKRNLRYSKGAIQIPYGNQLPLDLIRELADWCGVHHREK